jgi:hypothetical protein
VKSGTVVDHDMTTDGVGSTVLRSKSSHEYVNQQKLTPPGSVFKEQILPKNISILLQRPALQLLLIIMIIYFA